MVPSRSHRHVPPSVNASAERGAVLLMSIYLVSMSLLVLAGVSLQRTLQETQLATRSAQTQQALWLADSGLEEALRTFRTTLPTLDAQTPSAIPGASYRVSRRAADPSGQYLVTSTGTIGNISQRVYAFVDVGPPRIDFRYAVFGLEQVEAFAATYGGIDTRASPPAIEPLVLWGRPPRLLTPLAGTGSIGTNATTRNAVTLVDSYVRGDVFVGAGAANPSALVSSVDSIVTGQVKSLEQPMEFPPIVVPAVPLQNELGVIHLFGGQRRCLSPGTYTATGIVIDQGSELCTTGPVDLYVTSGEFNVLYYSQLYGQPERSFPHEHRYAPKNLRIFVMPGAGTPTVTGRKQIAFHHSSLGAAAIYAPDTQISIRRGSLFMGSIIGRTGRTTQPADGQPMTGVAAGPKIYYDQDLGRTPIRVNSTGTKVTVLWYGTSPPATTP